MSADIELSAHYITSTRGGCRPVSFFAR